jgi:hypothetical protein
MQRSNYRIDTAWQETPEGLEFEAKAVTISPPRIVARVTCSIPSATAEDLHDIYGVDGVRGIERGAIDSCHRLAQGYPG